MTFELAGGGGGEAEEDLLFVAGDLDDVHLFELLDAALDHAGFFDVGAELVDPVLDLGDLALLVLVGLAEASSCFSLSLDVVGVVALEAVEVAELELERAVGDSRRGRRGRER